MSVSVIDLRAAAMVVSVHVIDLRHAHGRDCDQSVKRSASKRCFIRDRPFSRVCSVFEFEMVGQVKDELPKEKFYVQAT